MSFRAWADVPETERVTEQSIRAYWEQRAKEAPDAPFVQRVDEFIDREVNTLRERLRSGSCEAAVASYGNVAPYLPCMHPQTTGSRFCWAHDRVAKRTGCETVSDYDRLVAAARAVVEAKDQTLTTWGYVRRSAVEGPFHAIFSAIDALAARLPDAAAGGETA